SRAPSRRRFLPCRPRSRTARPARASSPCRLPPRRTRGRGRRSPPVARGSVCGCSCPPDPAHAPELTPGRAVATLRVMAHVAGANPGDETSCQLLRPLDLPPERLLVEVVVAREAGHAVLLGLGPKQPASVTLPGQRPVDPSERLDPDQIPKHEHVERDLQLQLGLDLRRRVGGLAGLVVLDDPAGAERVEIDPVDLSGEREGAEIEPSLELLSRAFRAE